MVVVVVAPNILESLQHIFCVTIKLLSVKSVFWAKSFFATEEKKRKFHEQDTKMSQSCNSMVGWQQSKQMLFWREMMPNGRYFMGGAGGGVIYLNRTPKNFLSDHTSATIICGIDSYKCLTVLGIFPQEGHKENNRDI